MNKPRVVFTFVEAGLGHIVPATAVSQAFTRKYGKYCEIVNSNIFSGSKSKIIQKYSKKLSDWTKSTANNFFVRFIEKISYLFSSKITLKFLDLTFRKEKKQIMEEIKELKPDVIFSTYYSPSHFAIECKKKYGLDFIVGTYTPDPIIYPAWDKNGDFYFVNNKQAYDICEKKKFKSEVCQVPIIVRDEILYADKDKLNVRNYLGIENKTTVLISSGAYGSQKDKIIIKKILESNLNINLIVICGKNEQLFGYYNKLKEQISSKTSFIPIGFTKEMDKYLVASDLVLGKSGGNSLFEACYLKVPFVCTSCLNELERMIADYFVNKIRCALQIHDTEEIFCLVKDLANGVKIDKIEEIKSNFYLFEDATGAEKIADILFEALNKKYKLLEQNQ